MAAIEASDQRWADTCHFDFAPGFDDAASRISPTWPTGYNGVDTPFSGTPRARERWLSLAEMLELFRRKFSVKDISRVLYSLCYFDDADSDPMPKMHTSVTWEQAKADIRAWVKAIAAGAE